MLMSICQKSNYGFIHQSSLSSATTHFVYFQICSLEWPPVGYQLFTNRGCTNEEMYNSIIYMVTFVSGWEDNIDQTHSILGTLPLNKFNYLFFCSYRTRSTREKERKYVLTMPGYAERCSKDTDYFVDFKDVPDWCDHL